jgi:MGT family glycosyltransferase
MKLIFFNIPAHGHVNPTLPIVAELVRRGVDVVYVNSEEFRTKVEATGARFAPYPAVRDMDALIAMASGWNPAVNALALTKIGEILLPRVFEILEQEKPDVVIHDTLASWGKQAAKKHNLPTIASVSTFVITTDSLPDLKPADIVDMLIKFSRKLPAYWMTRQRMKQRFGIKMSRDLMSALMSLGDLNLVYTAREFQPSGEKFDDSYKFVGPAIVERKGEADFPFEQLTRSLLVYISLGTINNQNTEFYRQCFAAFADFGGQVILSAGKKTDIPALGDIPPNFIVRNYVPQLDILQRADLFITHGGMNSVHEGLYYGVPLMVAPQQLEQGIVTGQVVQHGAGIALGGRPPVEDVSAAELRAGAERILGDAHYKQAALRVGEQLRAAGGFARAADEIMAFGDRVIGL